VSFSANEASSTSPRSTFDMGLESEGEKNTASIEDSWEVKNGGGKSINSQKEKKKKVVLAKRKLFLRGGKGSESILPMEEAFQFSR